MAVKKEQLTARHKRQLLVGLVVMAYKLAFRNVAEEFRHLGYTEPESAEIRGIEYKFFPPPQTAEDVEEDGYVVDQRIVTSFINSQAPPPLLDLRRLGAPDDSHHPPDTEVKSGGGWDPNSGTVASRIH